MAHTPSELIVLIAGPTASGKSAAALRLADALDGEIVNADAMQVYRDLRTLTARPDEAEEAQAPHHLYGVLDGAERCSAGRWARLAARVIDEIRGRGRVPIVVGGTGLYFKALTEGLSPMPDVPEDIRGQGNRLFDAVGAAAFRQAVLSRDPGMAHLEENDRQRLIRAWEVHEATGTPLSAWQGQPREAVVSGEFRPAVLQPPRDALYARCDQRLEQMLQRDALNEVRALLARKLDPSLPVMKSLGVPEFAAHLAGELPLDEALALAQQNTRRFAKRQMTWFRGQEPGWPVFETADDLVEDLLSASS
ncbi:tRNA (adenosine(37)-N6)-dimethylallyltransferase MiaA [Aquisalinus flavus]|uniref:tRNA dimethylallyltransferase n=1 Tax=Aquisalinus flavus TaxID=1526572 RepID=A0A8J2V2D3_9PROT|nr:tRNA (adenosine(37)-N6)-dimethylallyltransferase MiaA [Aquisalinus flavus]MBD0427484.1 tRNA (adenosine(37)-N6)-dimethylallyltransferase MiaA [Aquisalinus flavus]UNE47280.1 tRNA (adenosine(37)-N6)-dimethylallyltransferase MiaA [Aquisalinus flavus]GGD01365.1 tRNA dimethylallyltransferase [Aquisalinus flavus]